MEETLTLTAQTRTTTGKKVASLRRAGSTPAVIYGPTIKSNVLLQFNTHTLGRALSKYRKDQPITIEVENGQKYHVKLQDYKRHPVRQTLLHLDFLAI